MAYLGVRGGFGKGDAGGVVLLDKGDAFFYNKRINDFTALLSGEERKKDAVQVEFTIADEGQIIKNVTVEFTFVERGMPPKPVLVVDELAYDKKSMKTAHTAAGSFVFRSSRKIVWI
ncbi:MAG: hypothetical protein LBT14_08130 [Treponema sp.]|nr:hypothetical protein [Treponema sp.]